MSPKQSAFGGHSLVPSANVVRRTFYSILFNVGVAVFVWESFRYLAYGPAEQFDQHRLHTLLFDVGLCLLGVSWTVSSSMTIWMKGLLSLVIIAGSVLAGMKSIHEFNLSERAMLPGTAYEGHVVYEGLGVSFDVPSNWQLNLQPFVTKSGKKSQTSSKTASRLAYGDTAIFFQAIPPSDPKASDKVADSIQVEGGPFFFQSLGRTLASVQRLESLYRSMAGVKIVRAMRYYEFEGQDFVEFEVLDEAHDTLYRHVFVRSGDIRLDFVLTTSGTKAPASFDQFIHSIRISRTPTRFNE